VTPIYFALEYEVVPNFVERRAPFRDEHLAHVRAARDRGEILMAGAVGEPPDGALLIFKAADASVAEAFADADPYVRQQLVVRRRVRRWHVVVSAT
jgi:uncharacterized protein